MKLLLENWRNFVIFENIETATRLSIFDFDETIAFSEGYVIVINKQTGDEFQISSQEEYDKLKNDGGYEFDFSPLDQVNNAVENPNITSIMRDRLEDPNTQVMVLTARAPISIDDIHMTLQTFDKPIETKNIIMIGNEGGNKGEYVRDVILSKYDNIKEIEFYDDSESNIRDMQVIKKETSDDGRIEKFDIYNVTEGIPNLT
tara:strand:+ start:667 stop:1272 length:606 start_codon:yes stop_codon:yes gene_type:complete